MDQRSAQNTPVVLINMRGGSVNVVRVPDEVEGGALIEEVARAMKNGGVVVVSHCVAPVTPAGVGASAPAMALVVRGGSVSHATLVFTSPGQYISPRLRQATEL